VEEREERTLDGFAVYDADGRLAPLELLPLLLAGRGVEGPTGLFASGRVAQLLGGQEEGWQALGAAVADARRLAGGAGGGVGGLA
jgi:DNA (cytosine-5)-methyltransferase 1